MYKLTQKYFHVKNRIKFQRLIVKQPFIFEQNL